MTQLTHIQVVVSIQSKLEKLPEKIPSPTSDILDKNKVGQKSS